MARRTKAEAEETRQKILDAAERLFFVDGVSRTSLELIANAAGVTRGAIYWHFKNKVELFEALHERVKLPAEDIVERAMADGHPDPLGLIEQAMVESFVALTEDEQRQRVFTILTCRCEYVGEMLAALARQREAHDHMRATMNRAFKMAQESGRLSPAWPPEVAASTLTCLMVGLMVDWIRFGRRFDLVETGTRSVGELFRSFRREAEPAIC